MNVMDDRKRETDIEQLTLILSRIQDLYYKKKDQLEDLKAELDEIKEILDALNGLISNQSFTSADELYIQSLEGHETLFDENIPKEKVKGTKIKRKIYSEGSQEQEELLAVLNFKDFNCIEIKFLAPEQRNIKETSENFISVFLKGALIQIKEKNPNLQREYQFYKDTDIIEKIIIRNIKSVEEYDLITSQIRRLLSIQKD